MNINGLPIDYIELSVRSRHSLHDAGITTVGDMLGCSDEYLSNLPNTGKKSVDEILAKIEEYKDKTSLDIYEYIHLPEFHDHVLQYVQANDFDINGFGLSIRTQNALSLAGFYLLSDIIFLSEFEFKELKNMGAGSVTEIVQKIRDYLKSNETSIRAICEGDSNALVSDENICQMILGLYKELGFKGLSLDEISERLPYSENISRARLKGNIGNLLASGELEYVDYRCYRAYGKFEDYLRRCPRVDERNRTFIERKLNGETLEAIANDYGLTRQRVQQAIKKNTLKVVNYYTSQTGLSLFDEDYYKYLFEHYDINKEDGENWLGITEQIRNYLQLTDTKPGTKKLEVAVEDRQIEAGMRQKIRNYLNRDKIYVNNTWVKRSRHELEVVVQEKFCQEKTSFDDFVQIYNDFLKNEGIPFDESIYITQAYYTTRKNHFAISRYLLSNLNECFRYYDIDNREYKDLLVELNLERFKDTEVSTLKLFEENPRIMRYYDIRDQYELHNLLRKIIPDGSLNDFHAGRMPTLCFGQFDRNEAILNLIRDNSPISQDELTDLIHQEYGFDKIFITWSMRPAFDMYYHDGAYSIDALLMPEDRVERLKELLNEDFYAIHEVRQLYKDGVPDGDMDEVGPFVLKSLGFKVRSGYIFRGAATIDDYIEKALLSEDIIDLTTYKKKFGDVQTYHYKLADLKNNLEIIEFEPNKLINIRKLENASVTKETLRTFCDSVYDFVEPGECFVPLFLRRKGFESPLFELGFDDLFYSSVLSSDERFALGKVYGAPIVCAGASVVTISSFLYRLISEHGVIDTFDLISELERDYKCEPPQKFKVINAAQDGGAFYDKILDRLYASEELYYEELDKVETA